MPANPTFKASYAEWRTVLDALHHYAAHLAATISGVEDADKHLIAYDDLERLDRIIPSFERQFQTYMDQTAAALDESASAPPS